jgi:transposase
VAALGATAAAREAAHGPAEPQPPHPPERHFVGFAHRCAVARPAGALRPGWDGVEPVLPVARGGFMGPGTRGAAIASRRAQRGGLEPAFRGCHCHSRPSIRCRGAPGRRRRGGEGEALGRSQGGFSTKLHLRAEGNGRPITAVLTGGERQEQIALERLLDQGAIRRSGRGRPRLRPLKVAGDKAYSSPTARRRLRRRGITPVIPTKSNQRRNPRFDRAAYRQRNRIERLINRLKQSRRIATRYEKRAVNYHAMVTIGMIKLWL